MLSRIIYSIAIITFSVACNDHSDKPSSPVAHSAADTTKDTAEFGEMKTYWMVFLLKGPNRTHDSATSARIQAAHLANIDRLHKEGKIVMAGPMGYNKDLRGIFIMDCKDSAEAASYIATDSAIITGRLRFEIHPWWTAKGKYEFK